MNQLVLLYTKLHWVSGRFLCSQVTVSICPGIDGMMNNQIFEGLKVGHLSAVFWIKGTVLSPL